MNREPTTNVMLGSFIVAPHLLSRSRRRERDRRNKPGATDLQVYLCPWLRILFFVAVGRRLWLATGGVGFAGGDDVKHGFATGGGGGGAQFDIQFHGTGHVWGGGVELVENVIGRRHDADLVADGVFVIG